MLRIVFLFLFGLLMIDGFAQEVTLTGVVLDTYRHPIPAATYFLADNTANKKRTENDGTYSITFNAQENDTVKFRHVGFDDFDLVITRRMLRRARNQRIETDVVLPEKEGDVIVVRSNVPDTLFGTQEYSVADYEFDMSGHIILLTYEKNLNRGSVLRVLDSTQSVIDAYYVPGDAIELRRDFRGNTHLITEEKVYLIRVNEGRMTLYLESRDYFFSYVAPLIDTIGANIYYSNYSDLYPAFDYLEFNRADSIYKPILKVEDELMMELYRSEFKYVDVRTKIWAHDKQLETGIDKEIWVGATVFTNSLYYEPLYAPLFKVGADSVFVFDHYKNLMFKYTPVNGFVDSMRITYHLDAKKSGWEQPLIQDRQTDKIYATFQQNGFHYLSEINKKGKVKRSFRLHFKYVEEVKVINGYVYYIYRPFESIQKKYIYREKLKVSDNINNDTVIE